MDWSDGAVIRRYEADTIMFADCIYLQRGGSYCSLQRYSDDFKTQRKRDRGAA